MNNDTVVLNIPMFSSLATVSAIVFEKGLAYMFVYAYIHKYHRGTYIPDCTHI